MNVNSRHLPRYTPLAFAICTAVSSVYVSSVSAGGIVLPPIISPDAVGTEFPINTSQSISPPYGGHSVAMDADGDFVVTWQSYSGIGDLFVTSQPYQLYSDIYARRFAPDGTPAVEGEFVVNSENTVNRHPSIAVDADGDFVVVWERQNEVLNGVGAAPQVLANGSDIYAQRFASDGTPDAEGEFLVNTDTSSNQHEPSVAMDADGDFVVVWERLNQVLKGAGAAPQVAANDIDIYAQRFAADGKPIDEAFLVNTDTSGDQSRPSIAMDADGDFVVAWSNYYATIDVYAQRFAADGKPIDEAFLVNTNASGEQSEPSVAMDADGDFVVAWQGQGTDKYATADIFAQRFSADGTPALQGEIRVNTRIEDSQIFPRAAMDADGDFVVTWQSRYQDNPDGKYGVYGQRYNADGTTDGEEFLVNTETLGNQQHPAVAMDADGDFVIAWNSDGNFAETDKLAAGPELEANDGNIFAQLFSGAGETVDLSLVVNDDTDPVVIGNNFMYSLMTTNNGTGIAMDVNLSEPLPTGLTYVSDDSASSGWLCAQAATTLECNLPFMTPGASNMINVTVTASSAGTTTNTVTASAAQTDINPADNTDTETTEITGGGDGGGTLFSLSWLTGLLLLPFALRRYRLREKHHG